MLVSAEKDGWEVGLYRCGRDVIVFVNERGVCVHRDRIAPRGDLEVHTSARAATLALLDEILNNKQRLKSNEYVSE